MSFLRGGQNGHERKMDRGKNRKRALNLKVSSWILSKSSFLKILLNQIMIADSRTRINDISVFSKNICFKPSVLNFFVKII